MSRSTMIETTHDNAIFYNISLSGFDSIWQSFILYVDVLSCKTAGNHAVVSFIVPWANNDQHYYSV